MRRLSAFLLFLLSAALLLAACGGGTIYTTIRHPLQVGAVDPNDVPFENPREERARGIPTGTLVDRAQLLTLTPDQICVRVVLWATQRRPERASLGAYRVALLNDQPGLELANPQVSLEAPTQASYNGFIVRTRASSRTFVSRSRQSFVWQITSQPSVLCFPNGGFVTPSTTRLVLELADAGAGNRINFEWAFDSAVASAPQ